MPVTTIKRCQSHPDWWYTVEDVHVDYDNEPQTGLTFTYFDSSTNEGHVQLRLEKPDALLIRDAINQLYPRSEFTAIKEKLRRLIEDGAGTELLIKALDQLKDN